MPSSVSKPLPSVVIVAMPFAGAVHVHQTDRPPAFPACAASPVSFVAPTFDPATVTDDPPIVIGFEKLSLVGATGAAVRSMFNSIFPVAIDRPVFAPSTAKW